VIFRLERVLNGGTKLTLELANKLGKPVLHIYDTRKERISNPDSLCLEIQALSDFVCSNKIEILNVASPRESKEPGVYEWTLTMLRLSLNRAASEAISKETVNEWTQIQVTRVSAGTADILSLVLQGTDGDELATHKGNNSATALALRPIRRKCSAKAFWHFYKYLICSYLRF
jgi:hypothetical protein